MIHKLLTRDEFRSSCFERDKNSCVICKSKEDLCVHHIVERRLFSDGGYYAENGATVCPKCHILCEQTTISVEEVRSACGISETKKVIPSHLYRDVVYDKWGNPILPNGTRLKGEIYNDLSIQKILKEGGFENSFVHYVKYPRTYHVPWSQGFTDDDRINPTMSMFEDKRVIVTTKMDGENTTMYTDYIHARSVDSKNHPSRNYIKGLWAQFCGDIPEGWRLCGENLYAKHSIHYKDLPSYLMCFSIWNEHNVCLDWDQTQEWFSLLNVLSVPVIYDGIYDEKMIKSLWDEKKKEQTEGYVIRIANEFSYGDFKASVAKFVRKNHVTSETHWAKQNVVPNEIKRNVPV
jgi:hypothetical protein